MRVAAADRLTREYGDGHWSAHTHADAVLWHMAGSRILVATVRQRIVGTLTLQTKRPWAIDVEYFTPVKKAIYLLNMAVMPDRQRQGIGRSLLVAAVQAARDTPADAIRLDAYDAPAGAGAFYRRCGYAPRGGKVYRGVPLLYFERMLGVDA